MASYWNYDNSKHKHRIMALEVKNELDIIVGFRPVVFRHDPKESCVMEEISERLYGLKWKIFTTEKACREFTYDFMSKINTTQYYKLSTST